MSNAVIRREALTYENHSPVSFFRDLVFRHSDPAAETRLRRHAQEMDAVSAVRAARAGRGLAEAMEEGGPLFGAELRTTPNRTQGTGGYFAVPLWLNEMFATAPRAPRVLAGLIPTFLLPEGCSAVSLPRLTTGNQAQPTADNAPAAGQDIVDAATTSAAVTIDGKGDFPKQLLEQSPAGAHLDWAMFKDASEAYDQTLETQLISGAGTGVYNDVFLQGLLNVAVPAGNKLTYTNATPVFSQSTTQNNNMYYYMGQASAQVGNQRKLPPEAWLMTTSRWSWISTSVDNQGRPIVPPDLAPPRHVRIGPDADPEDAGRTRAVSSIASWPIYVDDAVPATLGAGGNQDTIIACRPSDMILLEGEPKTMVSEEALSGTLGVRIVLRGYVAALVGRYPTGTAYLQGAGMIVQSGF